MKYKYWDMVNVIKGFHKGRKGRLINEAGNEYQVDFGAAGSGVIHKRNLEKVKEE